MTTALSLHRPLTQDVWAMIQSVAPIMKDSRLFGVATEAEAAAIMAKGYELGLSLTTAFEFVTVIQGKPALIPRGALALILNSGLLQDIQIKDETDDRGNPVACSVTMERKGGLSYTARFSMEDAKRANLIKPDSGWSKYPGNMLRWRAIGFAADIVFPDVLGGMKRADELGADLTPTGEVIEGSWTVSADPGPQPAAVVQPEPEPVDLMALVKEFGAEAVMAANGGKIPGSEDEVRAVANALRGAQ